MSKQETKRHDATAPEDVDAGRRRFLLNAGLAAGAVTVATGTGANPAEAQQFPPEPGATRYQLTPHIERFYALNRL